MSLDKILIITSSFPKGKGESFIEPELEYLSTQYLVDVLPTYPRGKDKKIKARINGRYIESPLFTLQYFVALLCYLFLKPLQFYLLVKDCLVNDWFKSCRNIALLPKAIFIANTIMKDGSYQIIYCHWLSAPAQLSFLLSTITKTPFSVTAHRWDIIDDNNLEKKLSNACFIRLISEHSKSLFSKCLFDKYNENLTSLYLGVKLDDVKPKECLLKTPFVGICIASLVEVKGHIYLFKAIQQVVRKGFNIKFGVIGGGVLKNNLIQLAKDLEILNVIKFYGNLEHQEVIKLLSSHKIHFSCLASIDLGAGNHEGIPVALMESMSFGIPCISTNTGSISELIEHNENGLLVKDKNTEQLADAIITMISNPDKYHQFSLRSRIMIEEKFNSNTNNLELSKMIHSCLLVNEKKYVE